MRIYGVILALCIYMISTPYVRISAEGTRYESFQSTALDDDHPALEVSKLVTIKPGVVKQSEYCPVDTKILEGIKELFKMRITTRKRRRRIRRKIDKDREKRQTKNSNVSTLICYFDPIWI